MSGLKNHILNPAFGIILLLGAFILNGYHPLSASPGYQPPQTEWFYDNTDFGNYSLDAIDCTSEDGIDLPEFDRLSIQAIEKEHSTLASMVVQVQKNIYEALKSKYLQQTHYAGNSRDDKIGESDTSILYG